MRILPLLLCWVWWFIQCCVSKCRLSTNITPNWIQRHITHRVQFHITNSPNRSDREIPFQEDVTKKSILTRIIQRHMLCNTTESIHFLYSRDTISKRMTFEWRNKHRKYLFSTSCIPDTIYTRFHYLQIWYINSHQVIVLQKVFIIFRMSLSLTLG